MKTFKIGDRVIADDRGPGTIVNRETFDKYGQPSYDMKNPLHDALGIVRYGVRLDNKQPRGFPGPLSYWYPENLRAIQDQTLTEIIKDIGSVCL